MVYLSNYEMITRRQVNELSLKCEMRPSGSQTLKAPLVETHLQSRFKLSWTCTPAYHNLQRFVSVACNNGATNNQKTLKFTSFS